MSKFLRQCSMSLEFLIKLNRSLVKRVLVLLGAFSGCKSTVWLVRPFLLTNKLDTFFYLIALVQSLIVWFWYMFILSTCKFCLIILYFALIWKFTASLSSISYWILSPVFNTLYCYMVLAIVVIICLHRIVKYQTLATFLLARLFCVQRDISYKHIFFYIRISIGRNFYLLHNILLLKTLEHFLLFERNKI